MVLPLETAPDGDPDSEESPARDLITRILTFASAVRSKETASVRVSEIAIETSGVITTKVPDTVCQRPPLVKDKSVMKTRLNSDENPQIKTFDFTPSRYLDRRHEPQYLQRLVFPSIYPCDTERETLWRNAWQQAINGLRPNARTPHRSKSPDDPSFDNA